MTEYYQYTNCSDYRMPFMLKIFSQKGLSWIFLDLDLILTVLNSIPVLQMMKQFVNILSTLLLLKMLKQREPSEGYLA
jgi:hypothetical protein